jgi:hypothetical protein
MNWKEQIPASFGCEDHIFANHPKDQERASKMMKEAFASGASINELLAAVSEYLKSKNCPDEHIEKQLEKVRNLRGGYEI